MRSQTRAASALVALSAALAAATAPAASRTAAIGVSSTVVAACTISAPALSFGAYTPGAGNVAGASVIRIACPLGQIFYVALSAGTTPGTSMGQRLLSNGANTLGYNLYWSTAYTTVIGDGTGGSAYGYGFGLGLTNPLTLSVYGHLPDSPANRAAPAGTYSDTITVTTTF